MFWIIWWLFCEKRGRQETFLLVDSLTLLWLRSIFLLFRSSLMNIMWPCCVLKWFCQTDFPFMASWFFSDGILTEGRRQDGVCGQQARHQRCPPQHVCCQQRRWCEEHLFFFLIWTFCLFILFPNICDPCYCRWGWSWTPGSSKSQKWSWFFTGEGNNPLNGR